MGGSKPTIGYKYYLGVHCGICAGPVDEVRAIYFDGKLGWSGSQTANGAVKINKPNLFGGEKKEGGVAGMVDIDMGGPAQGVNEYLQARIGGNVPAYRGLLSLVFRGARTWAEATAGDEPGPAIIKTGTSLLAGIGKAFYWSAMNPYIKPVAVEVKRIMQGWSAGVWYSAKAAIGNDMNPVHIIYQAITEPLWGSGLSSSLIDDAKWRAAADTLYAEGFGLSLMWVQQQPVEDFVAEILRHIDAALYLDATTGKFVLKLNRADYTVGTLPIYGPDQIGTLDSYRRAAWGETTNEIVLSYTDAVTEEEATVAVQDLSNIRIQGGIVSATRTYAGVRTAALAYRLAERDLRVVSTPLAAVRFTINRSAWALNAGSVFRLNWPDYGLTDVVFRVTNIARGTLSDNNLSIEAIEDVFALPTNSYGAGQGSGWVDPSGPAAPITSFRLMEATYFDLVKYYAADEVAGFSTDASYPIVVAEQTSAQNTAFEVYSSPTTDIDDFVSAGLGSFTPTVVIPLAITDKEQTSIVYSTPNNFGWDGDLGAYAYWDDEIVEVVSVDPDTFTLTIQRGVLDSIPQTHGVNSKLWFWDGELGAILTDGDFVRDEVAHVRSVGISASGPGDLTAATDTAYTNLGRWAKPWPPADVKINGSYAPTVVRGNFTITWKGRNRLQQTVGYNSWYDAHVVPELGTTYSLEIYDGDTNVLMQTVTGLTTVGTGGTYNYPGGTNAAKYKLKFYAVRAGLKSHASWEHTADIAGYGLNYDLGYGGFTAGVVLPPSVSAVIPLEQYTPTPFPSWINGGWRDMETGSFRTSTDNGVSWFVEAVTAYNPVAMLQTSKRVIHGNGFYVAMNSSAWYWYRKDGGLWTAVLADTLPGSFVNGGNIGSITYDGTQFVLVRNEGKDIHVAADLSAGTASWTHVGPASANQLSTRMNALFLMKVGSVYVAIGASGGNAVVSTSSDLLSWSAATVVPTAVYAFAQNGALFNGSYFVVANGDAAAGVPMRIYKSADLVTWTELSVGAVPGMWSASIVVLDGAMFVLSNDHIVKTLNGTSFSVSRANFAFDVRYVQAKRTNWTAESGPSRAIIIQPLTKEDGGKLLYMNDLTSAAAPLLYPGDALNGADIGVLGFGGQLVEDSGFLLTNSGTSPRMGFVARNTSKRYFEVKLVANLAAFGGPSLSAPLIHQVGVGSFGSVGGDGGITSFGINSNGFLQINGGAASTPPTGTYAFRVGQVFGFEVDFAAKTASLLIDNVLFAAVENIDTQQKWVPTIGAFFCQMELNTGQKTFAYSRPGTSPWGT